MVRTRFSLLGVLAAAVVLIALFARSAQAETGAKWLVLTGTGSNLYTQAEIEARNEKFEGSIELPSAALLGKALGIKLAIKCTAAELIDALLGPNGSVKNGAKVKFTGCTLLSGGTDGLLEETCELKSAGQPFGTVVTNSAHALLKLHELAGGVKDDTLLILPDVGNEFTNFQMDELCPFGENIPIAGSLSLQDCEGTTSALTHKLAHLFTQFTPLTKLYIISDTAEHLETKIDGSVNIKLASDKLWSGDPA
jgi:hypothetical protein